MFVFTEDLYDGGASRAAVDETVKSRVNVVYQESNISKRMKREEVAHLRSILGTPILQIPFDAAYLHLRQRNMIPRRQEFDGEACRLERMSEKREDSVQQAC